MHSFTRTVIHGKELGRKLGYPTANMRLDPSLGILAWVYAVLGNIDGRILQGVGVYFPEHSTFETHFLDFYEDIYDRDVSIEVLYKVRENAKFDSFEELKMQIERDIAYVRKKWQRKKIMDKTKV